MRNLYIEKLEINKNKRIKDGLIIYHIDEDKVINLAKKDIAKKHSFTYQQKERLIYCNYLERLLLYMKILENDLHQKKLIQINNWTLG